MKYFSLIELIHSDTANYLNIDNTPSKDVLVNLELLIDNILDVVREKWGSPIIVTSGFRCEALNRAVKGAKYSQHIKGQAADIKPKKGTVKELFDLIEELIDKRIIEVGQLIDEYDYKWIHISLPTNNKHNQILHLK